MVIPCSTAQDRTLQVGREIRAKEHKAWCLVIGISAAAPVVTYLSAAFKLPNDWRFVVAIAMLLFLSSMLAVLQIFFRDSERAEKHRTAGATYAKLEMEIEKLIAFLPPDANDVMQRIEEFRDQWARLTGGSPVIPQDIYDKECGEIEKRPTQ